VASVLFPIAGPLDTVTAMFPRLSPALFLSVAAATLAAKGLHSGSGLAGKYPRDEGLARDPAVVLFENFETGDLADLKSRWSDISNAGGKALTFSEEAPAPSGGNRSLQLTSTLGENTGGHLYTRLSRELDTAFARFYVRFADDAQYVHHFVHFGGYRPSTSYAQGGAGERPRGDERFTVGIEPYGDYGRHPAPGAWNFYAYWPEMKVSADGKFWGASIPPLAPALVPRARWQCVEIMLKANSAPEGHDGELALWLDGQLVQRVRPGTPIGEWTGMGFRPQTDGAPFPGFRWRTDSRLKINFFWLLFYVTENAARQNKIADPAAVNRVWFDDIVVASEYIGPVQP
jgi:hypothetical protein